MTGRRVGGGSGTHLTTRRRLPCPIQQVKPMSRDPSRPDTYPAIGDCPALPEARNWAATVRGWLERHPVDHKTPLGETSLPEWYRARRDLARVAAQVGNADLAKRATVPDALLAADLIA